MPQPVHSEVSRANVVAALERSHADGSYWGGGEISAMSGPGPVEAARAGRALPQVAMN